MKQDVGCCRKYRQIAARESSALDEARIEIERLQNDVEGLCEAADLLLDTLRVTMFSGTPTRSLLKDAARLRAVVDNTVKP